MTKDKRFILKENGINDREYEFSILGEDELVDIINELNDENEQLKKELFEAEKDYILETYADNSIRRDEKLKALEKEFEE